MMSLALLPLTLLSLTTAPGRPVHQATVAGALNATLAGEAVFGPVRGVGGAPASFSLELGTWSEKGAVVFSRVSGERPRVGSYQVSTFEAGAEGSDVFHALISLGSVERPLGVFRAVSGTVTITQSTAERIVGRYEVKAVGFLAADAENEDREITVRGGFSAEPSASPSRFEATISGAIQTVSRGAAEFGDVGDEAERGFSLTLGAYSEQGAVVLSTSSAGRPATGVYLVRESAGFHGLVISGSPSQPTGVFRVQRGTLSITESTASRLAGRFELHGVGFLAADPDREDREVTVSGTFIATPSGQLIALNPN